MPLSAACSRVQGVPVESALCMNQAPVPPPSYQWTMATALHLDALALVTRSAFPGGLARLGPCHWAVTPCVTVW
jgi:hypothetical protein